MSGGAHAAAARITVGGPAPYDVLVGHAVTRELADLLGPGVAQVGVIASQSLNDFGAGVAEKLTEAGYAVRLMEVPDGEEAKTAGVAAACWEALGEANFTRSDAIVSVGGGATTDLAGFVAATWLRGVKVVHVPTTLLAMVDAAVGGKTGINTAAGKNLVGSFHPPAGVLCGLAALDTLPGPEWISGMAEVVKAGFIADPTILDLVESDPAGAAVASGPHTRELITRAIQVKADVVAVDLKETGAGGSIGREMLNYGHTLGHAIEKVEDYHWRHGEAIAVGMVFVAELAHVQGRISADLVARHRSVFSALGLPTQYRADRWDVLQAAMRVDKKARGDRLRFVVLDDLGVPVIAESPTPEELTEAFRRVSA
ncbi:3-dehydroquinate synthase [Sporichthya brevicatena]|uniref:3-dehydroquinate synthase n=1 Tax=Sporichthya brevicatena TaxID=171442 RepID=A0ABN1H1B1_9ACTN